jgi:hypothetical protein
MARPNGSGQCVGAAKERILGHLINFADELDQGWVVADQWRDGQVEVLLIDRIDLGGDDQLHADVAGQLDGAVGTLLGADASKEDEVIAGVRVKTVVRKVDSVVDDPHPVDIWQRGTLRLADGDEW